MTGGPSQVDTFDYKPELQKRNGQTLAGADPKTGFFTTSGKCLASPFKWKQHGKSGSWVSGRAAPTCAQHADDMAFIHSCHSVANNHAPASMELAARHEPARLPEHRRVADLWPRLGQRQPARLRRHARRQAARRRRHLVARLPAQEHQPLLLDARQKEAIRDVSPLAGMTDARPAAQLELLRRGQPRPPSGAVAVGNHVCERRRSRTTSSRCGSLNYFDHPVEAITLRVAGKLGFGSAWKHPRVRRWICRYGRPREERK